jgi:hypothetical protein
MNEEFENFHHRLVGYLWGLLELAIRYHQGVVIDKVVLEHTGWVELVAEVQQYKARQFFCVIRGGNVEKCLVFFL